MIRLMDIILSLIGILLLAPLMALITIVVLLSGRGSPFFIQERVGKDMETFRLFKFRTMHTAAEKKGLITVGTDDSRITCAGRILRRAKLDELPQLFNVLSGKMSIVGPRPEVREFVNFYTEEQKRVLSIRPGITDYASIHYSDENKILAGVDDPRKFYIQEVLPKKIELNFRYLDNRTVREYFRVILMTIRKMIRRR